MGIRFKRTSGWATLCERKPVVVLLVLGAAAVRTLAWLARGAWTAGKSILGRWARAVGPAVAARAAKRVDESGDRPGWPGADEVEAALEDLRRQAA